MPVKIAEINDLPLGGRDFHYVEHTGTLYVAVSEMKIASRLDSYITNVSLKFLSYNLSSLCLGRKKKKLRRLLLLELSSFTKSKRQKMSQIVAAGSFNASG